MTIIPLLLFLFSFGVVISTTVHILKTRYQNRPLSKGSSVFFISRTFVMLPYWYVTIIVALSLLKSRALLSPELFRASIVIISILFVVFYICFAVSEFQKRAMVTHIAELISEVRSEQEIDDEDSKGLSK